MRGRIDQSAVIVLAMDLDEFRPYAPKRLDADGFIVDESAGAPVDGLDTP
jgi:hypothetical protein